jgi:hypothetical protein
VVVVVAVFAWSQVAVLLWSREPSVLTSPAT